jgi:hypothetical protein
MASLRAQRRKSCNGKVRHGSFKQANTHAKQLRLSNERWVMPYKCKFCGGYHVGHAPKNVRQSIKAKNARAHGHKI